MTTTFRFDPVVDQTIDVAVGAELVAVRRSGKVRLTEQGTALAEAIEANEDVLRVEKEFLAALPGSLSEAEIERRLGWGGTS